MHMNDLESTLTSVIQEPVVDETGLTEGHDFDLNFEPPAVLTGRQSPGNLPDIFVALQKELGLNLSMKKVPRALIIFN